MYSLMSDAHELELWMAALLILPLLLLSSPAPARAAQDHAPSATPALRYFQYWAKYGDRAARPGDYRELSFELSPGRMNVFGPAPGSRFCGPVGASVLRELSALLAGMPLRDWEGALPEGSSRDAFDLLREHGETHCVWSLTLVFMEDAQGNAPARIRLSGMDDGRSPQRLRGEAALARFFAAQCQLAQAAAPRRVEYLEYLAGSGEQRVRYGLHAEDGKIRLTRMRQGEQISEYVHASILSRLDSLIRSHNLDSWHGFTGAGGDVRAASAFDLQLQFDTQQEIRASGKTDRPGGTPPRFAEVDGALRTLLDGALGGDAAGRPDGEAPGSLREFSFSTGGMSADSHISYELYRRRDAAGPRMVLRRQRGIHGDAKEVILDKSALNGLESYIQELNLSAWNGFRGNAKDVLDGAQFGLRIRFADGSIIAASGSNAWPEAYGTRTKALFRYLDALLARDSGAAQPQETDTASNSTGSQP